MPRQIPFFKTKIEKKARPLEERNISAHLGAHKVNKSREH
jgi:hypothetical protein